MTEQIEFTLGATIPTMQYGNLAPQFTVKADTFEQARDRALAEMKLVWDKVCEKPLTVRGEPDTAPANAVPLTCWASGTVVMFEPNAHVYGPGRWLSGSAFAGKYTSEFMAELIAGKMAVKHGVNAAEILAMWKLNAEASMSFGTSLHAAIQLYGTYLGLSEKVKGSNESALTKNLVLRPIVESFFEGREDETAVYEAFVADPVLKHCGQIDRLVIEDDGLVVEDYKSNADLGKSETIKAPFKGVVPNTALGAYWLQLSFYARILQAHGQVVKGLRIHHWDGVEWVLYEHEVVDLGKVLVPA